MEEKEKALVDSELPMATVLEVVEEEKGRFWEWPIGAKFIKRIKASVAEEVIFYQYSFAYKGGTQKHEFFRVQHPETSDSKLVINFCNMGSEEVKIFEDTYFLRTSDNLSLSPISADGYDIEIGYCFWYDFPGRNCNEKCVRVKVLNHAFSVAVCVQTVDELARAKPLSDRIMIVHSSRLRKGVYYN